MNMLSRSSLWRCWALCLTLVACGRDPGGDPMRVVPADVQAAAVAPSLSLLQARTAGFLAGIEGASGALDLMADRFGLDLRTPEGPAKLGLDSDKAIAFFTRGAKSAARAWVAVASVTDPELFLEQVRSRLQNGAGATLAAGQPAEPPAGGAWRFVGPGGDKATWQAAVGVTTDRVGIIVIAATTVAEKTAADGVPAVSPSAAVAPFDVIGEWNAVAGGRAETSFATSDKAKSAKATLGDGEVLYLVLDGLLPDAPKQLGLLRGFVQNMRDSLPTFTGGVALPLGANGVDALVLKLSAAHVGDGFLPVQWVTPAGSPDRLSRAFPKTTTAFVRFRIALDNVRSLPSFLLESVLPERLPGLESLPLPSVADMIELIEGDVAVALLGLDANANLGRLGALRSRPSEALSIFHLALAARMRDPNAMKRSFAGIASQLATSGWTVAAITPSAKVPPGQVAYEGWSLVREQQHYAVLIDDQVVVFIIGAGEVDNFLAVKEGRALSLASFGEHGSSTVKEALGLEGATVSPSAAAAGAPVSPSAAAAGAPVSPSAAAAGAPVSPSAAAVGATAMGLTLGPLRLSRELSARGLPPYFLKIINDVRLFSVSVGATQKKLDLALEISL